MNSIIHAVYKATDIKKRKVFLLMVLYVISGVVVVANLEIINSLVNIVVEGEYDKVFIPSICIVIIVLIGIIIDRIIMKYSNKVSLQLEVVMKKKYYIKLQRCYIADIEKYSQADLFTRFNDDINCIIDFLLNKYIAYLAKVLKLLLIFFYIGYYNKYLLIFVVIAPFILALSRYYGRKSGEEYGISRKYKSEVNAVAKDIVENRENIRNYKAGNFFQDKYEQNENKFITHELKKIFYDIMVWIAGVIGYQTIYILIYVIGGVLAYHNLIGLGLIVSLFTIIDPMVDIIMELPCIVPDAYNVSVNIKNYNELINLRERIINCDKDIMKIEDKYSFEYQNVSFTYLEKKVLDSISLFFGSNDKIAVIGKSGCGKSTLLKLLMGYDDIFEGKVMINGKNIENLSDSEIKNIVSFLPQEVFLQSDTIKSNIKTITEYNEEQLKFYSEIAEVIDDINRMPEKFETVLENNGENVSLGQKKRLGILMALLRNKKLLIMDETLSSVDKATEIKILDNIFNQLEIGIILVTHRVCRDVLERFDKIILMEQGKIIAYDVYENIAELPLYKELEKESTFA